MPSNASSKSGKNAAPSDVIVLSVLGVVCAVTASLSYAALPKLPAIPLTSDNRWLIVAKLLCFSILPVLVSLNIIMMHRFSNPRLRNPVVNKEADIEQIFRVKQQISSNTIEQFLLHVAALVGMAAIVENSAPLVLLTSLFVIGRLLFSIGYFVGPVYRTPGFFITFVPSTLAIMYSVWCVCVNGLDS